MGADNWTKCPRCHGVPEGTWCQEDYAIALDNSYGKVSLEEYKKLQEEFAAATPRDRFPETFAEFYEIGVYREDFMVDYAGSCSCCNYRITFKRRTPLPAFGGDLSV